MRHRLLQLSTWSSHPTPTASCSQWPSVPYRWFLGSWKVLCGLCRLQLLCAERDALLLRWPVQGSSALALVTFTACRLFCEHPLVLSLEMPQSILHPWLQGTPRGGLFPGQHPQSSTALAVP